jgi:hypothetical protein
VNLETGLTTRYPQRLKVRRIPQDGEDGKASPTIASGHGLDEISRLMGPEDPYEI